jgi:hypothetical protein
MHQERGLQTAVAIVLSFSLLWTLAILVPDKSLSAQDGTSLDVIVIHESSPRIQRVRSWALFAAMGFVCRYFSSKSCSSH